MKFGVVTFIKICPANPDLVNIGHLSVNCIVAGNNKSSLKNSE
jgi:hypothetical protein